MHNLTHFFFFFLAIFKILKWGVGVVGGTKPPLNSFFSVPLISFSCPHRHTMQYTNTCRPIISSFRYYIWVLLHCVQTIISWTYFTLEPRVWVCFWRMLMSCGLFVWFSSQGWEIYKTKLRFSIMVSYYLVYLILIVFSTDSTSQYPKKFQC